MNEINKRYNIGMSIINNNQGVKTMLNNIIKPSRIIKSYKIFNRLKSIINKVFENVGYFFIGYKVDIEQNANDIRAIRKYKIGLHEFKELKNELNTRIDMLESSMIESGKKAIYKDVHNIKDELTKAFYDVDDNINLTNERGEDGTK